MWQKRNKKQYLHSIPYLSLYSINFFLMYTPLQDPSLVLKICNKRIWLITLWYVSIYIILLCIKFNFIALYLNFIILYLIPLFVLEIIHFQWLRWMKSFVTTSLIPLFVTSFLKIWFWYPFIFLLLKAKNIHFNYICF